MQKLNTLLSVIIMSALIAAKCLGYQAACENIQREHITTMNYILRSIKMGRGETVPNFV